MGPFPFIRFESIEQNAGFMPQSRAQSELLFVFFSTYLTNGFAGITYLNAIELYKTKISEINLPINGGNLRLVYPKPFPAITGVQTLTFKVQNDQLEAVNSDQYVGITLNLTNGIITGNSYSFVGVVPDVATYDSPLLLVEKKIQNTLKTFDQSGAAIFPDIYKFNRNTLVAKSGLILAKDWKLTNGNINRFPLPENPYKPNDWILVEPFKADHIYILSQFGKIINKGFASGVTVANLADFALSIIWPDGWTMGYFATFVKIEFVVLKGNEGFLLAGVLDTTWTFQRFYSDLSPTNDPLFLTGWPYIPNTGRFFNSKWYGLEQLQFIEKIDQTSEGIYLQPIKSGDQLQFNIIKKDANMGTVDSCSIGIFDCKGVFIQKVGEAMYPACKANSTFISRLPLSIPIATILPAITTSNTIFTLKRDSGSITTITIPFASLDFSSQTNYAQSVVNYLNALGGYSATYSIGTSLNFAITILDLDNDVYLINWSSNTYSEVGIINIRCFEAAQLNASVTVPSLKNGQYYFGLYNLTGYVSEIYSFSNVLVLNNSENFTQILEIGNGEDAIIEGFEYLEGWMQRVRVALNGAGQTVTIEESIYRNTDGTFQKPMNSTDENISLHTDYLDLATQRAMTSATRHSIFVIKGLNLSVQEDLEIATIQDHTTNQSFRKLQQMKFSAKIQGYQPDNNACLG